MHHHHHPVHSQLLSKFYNIQVNTHYFKGLLPSYPTLYLHEQNVPDLAWMYFGTVMMFFRCFITKCSLGVNSNSKTHKKKSHKSYSLVWSFFLRRNSNVGRRVQ